MGVAKKLIDKKVLRDLVPINALSAIHLEEISRKALITDVRAGRYVFKAGDRDYQSVYLLEGKIELIADKGEVVGEVKAGSEAARHPLAHKQPRQLSARAVGKVTIACVDSNLLDVLLTWDESAGYDVVEIDAQDDDDWMTRMLQSQTFLQLPPSNIHQLLMRLETVSARAGEVIVRQGDDGDYFYIVKSGRLAVTRKASSRSKEVALAELGDGACFGEEALVSDTKRNASVTMITDGDLMRLSKQDFRELLCTPLVHEIGIEEARELASSGARWLDVRLPGEFENQAIKGSRNLPLSALRDESAILDSDATYILCCDTGRRSAAGAFVLGQRGFKVYTLKNGLMKVPEEMLIATPGAGSENTGQPGREAEIIPFGSENRHKETDARRDQERVVAEGLKAKVEALERDLQQLRTERQALEERLRSDAETGRTKTGGQEALIARLEKEQQESDGRLRQLEQDLARVRDDYRQLGQRASGLGGERDAALRDLEKSRAEIQTLKQQLSSRQGQESEQLEALEKLLEQRARELDEEKNQCRGLQQQLDERGSAHQALEQELDTLRRHAETQTSGHEALASELETARSRAEELQSLLTAAEEREKALRAQIGDIENASREALAQARAETSAEQQALEQRIADMRAQLDEKARMLEDALSRHRELEQESAEAAQAQAQAKEAQRAAEEAAHLLGSEAAGARELLNQQISDLQQRLDENTRLLEEETSRRSEAQEKLSALDQERETLSGREQALQEDLRQTQQQLDESRQVLEKATQQAGEFEQQLTEARQHAAASQQQVNQLESRLKELSKDHESDIASVRGALARAQDERENVLREQKRLMDSFRKAENALAQAREDHAAEVYRLREELKDGAGEANAGLAAELEALQEQLKQQVNQRRDLEITLGSRSEQLENAQLQVERLDQQLLQARDSARQAEQQLVEANQCAEQEMTVRLQTEEESRQTLRAELEKVTLERNEHQERLTVLVQEVEELRHALTTQEATETAATESQRQLEALREQLQQVEQERDGLRESESRMQQEADQLRAEAEVTRGLVNMAPADDGGLALREELIAAKKNVDVAVRLRAQAEAKASELEQKLVALEAQLERAHAQSADNPMTARIPSLDRSDPQASVVLNAEFEDPDDEEDIYPAAGVLLDADSAGDSEAGAEVFSGAVQSRVRGRWKYRVAGLLIGGLAVAAGVWWLLEPPDLPIAPADPPAAEADAAEAPPALTPQPATAVIPVAPVAKSETRTEPPPAWGLPESEPESGSRENETTGTEASPAAASPAAAGEVAAVSGSEDDDADRVIAQPAGYFRDRLSSGASGPEMVKFNADRFPMGSSPSSPNFDERPRHHVQLKRFAISRYETTFDEYDRFARDTGRARPNDMGWGRDRHPVVNVSWEDATAYAQWLSRQTGHRYRLPTEAEWEFVARAGTGTRFWWGNEKGEGRASCFDCGAPKAGRATVAVGSFESSGYGVYDMAGNAREWVMDCYTPNYAEAPADGGAVDAAGCSSRVVRGGGFSSPSDKLRSTARDASAPRSRLNDLGFRVVREY